MGPYDGNPGHGASSHFPQAGDRGWAVAVIGGGRGHVLTGPAAARIAPDYELEGGRPQVAAWTCSLSALNCTW